MFALVASAVAHDPSALLPPGVMLARQELLDQERVVREALRGIAQAQHQEFVPQR